ncbi:MAG TPA: thermonuclease family protein [Bauldia sp.]|nr:thermonuclease family protein [Bauldia sp.]
MHRTVLLAFGVLCSAGVAMAKDRLAGPVAADVIRAIDGDTIEVRATIWIGQELTTAVRLRGIDAPELHGKCPMEKAKAAEAAEHLAVIARGSVQLTNVENDKYGGRVIADVTDETGETLSARMLASGLVHPYDGGERAPWCGLASAG